MKNYSEAFLLSLITANIPRIIAANIIPHSVIVGITTTPPSPLPSPSPGSPPSVGSGVGEGPPVGVGVGVGPP